MSSSRRTTHGSGAAVADGDTIADGREVATQTTAVLGVRPRPLSLAPGTQIGRYVIGERVGRGGMGVVYKAHDPELDRYVAIKLLRVKARRDDEDRSKNPRVRLLREAQAMAQLSHPNVISVYDAGEYEGAVFLAMELVQGVSMRTWLRERPRTWREVVSVMLEAGRGLAAAHGHRLVHRDFKPDNIMLGADGRVCVIDFGLARHADGELESAHGEGSVDGDSGERLLDTPLTRVGDVVGTPKYMAPEQLDGAAVDARSDQFSYCVTLFEGIYGARPFSGETTEALLTAMRSEPLQVPDRRGVPGWLRKLVERGLSPEPAERFRDMPALLAELSRDHARRLRAAAVGVAFVAAVAATAFALTRGDATPPCRTAPAQIAEAWGPAQRARIEAGFAATGHTLAAPTASRVSAVLDTYASEWAGMRTQACEATHVHGAQSEELLDLRNACLDRRRSQLASLVDVLATASDPDVVERGVQAAGSLSPVGPCADVASLTAVAELPSDPEQRRAIAVARNHLDRAHALGAAGDIAAGLELAGDAVESARALGYAPLIAEALYQRGGLLDKAGQPGESETVLYEAAHVATVARDDRTAARAWIDLIWNVGFRQSRYTEAMTMLRFAEAIVERVGDPLLRAHLRGTLGAVYITKGDHDAAIRELTETLATRERLLGPDNFMVANTLDALSYATESAGRLDEARGYAERALALRQRTLGEDHLDVAFALTNLGEVHLALRDLDRAADYAARALALRESRLGTVHPSLGAPLGTLAAVALQRGDYAEADALLARAVAIFDEHVAPNHPATSAYYTRMGEVDERQQRWDEAIAHYRRVIEVISPAVGEDHPSAIAAFTRMGVCELGAGRTAAAIATLERAIELAGDGDDGARVRADAEFALARATWASDRARSRRLAAAAKAAYATGTSPAVVDERRAIDAWIAAHP